MGMFNTVTMAIEVQYHGEIVGNDLDYTRAQLPPEWIKSVLDATKDILLFIFSAELLAKLAAFRLKFFTGQSKHWNLVDLFIVGFGVTDRFSIANLGLDATMLRLLRLIKLTRFLKLFKTLSKSLQTMTLIFKSVQASV